RTRNARQNHCSRKHRPCQATPACLITAGFQESFIEVKFEQVKLFQIVFSMQSQSLSAVLSQENFSLCFFPFSINCFRRFSSLYNFSIPSLIDSTENGSTSSPAFPATPGMDVTLEVITGTS